MKTRFFIALLSFVPLLMQAQTDSLYQKEFAKKVNVFRKEKSMKPLILSRSLNQSAETVIKKSSTFKDSKGKYIKDSVRVVMQRNGIFDYQFEVLEKAKTKKNGFVIGNKFSSELQNALVDSLHNTVGIASASGSELIILTKHYVDIDPEITVNVSLIIGTDRLSEQVEIKGVTKLTNLIVNSYDMSKGIEANEPIDILKLNKDHKNKFKIEIDISKFRQRVPKQISIIDSLGNIISVIPI